MKASISTASSRIFATSPARWSFARKAVSYGRSQVIVAVVVGLIVSALPPTYGVGLVLGLGVLLYFLAQPQIGIYALLFAVPFGTLQNLQTGGLNVTVTEAIVFCVSVAWIGRATSIGEAQAGRMPWRGPLLVYGAVLLISITQAKDLVLSLKEMLKWGEMLFAYITGVLLIRSRRDLRLLLALMFGAVVLETVVGVGQIALHGGAGSFARGGFLRAAGTFDQPNPFAGYLNMIFPLAVAFLAYRVFPRRLMWLVVAVSGGGVLASLSRGGELASIGALLAMGGLASRTVRAFLVVGMALAALLVAGIVAGVLPSSVTDSVAQGLGVANVDVQNPNPVTWAVAERLAHQQAGLAMWADHPILGVGIGNYAARYDQYKVAPVWQLALGHAHNYYINIGAEAGIIGLAAFLILIGSAIVLCVRTYRSSADPLFRAIALGGLGVIVGVSIHSFFDDIFVHSMEVQVALVMVAVSRAMLGTETTEEAPPIAEPLSAHPPGRPHA